MFTGKKKSASLIGMKNLFYRYSFLKQNLTSRNFLLSISYSLVFAFLGGFSNRKFRYFKYCVETLLFALVNISLTLIHFFFYIHGEELSYRSLSENVTNVWLYCYKKFLNFCLLLRKRIVKSFNPSKFTLPPSKIPERNKDEIFSYQNLIKKAKSRKSPPDFSHYQKEGSIFQDLKKFHNNIALNDESQEWKMCAQRTLGSPRHEEKIEKLFNKAFLIMRETDFFNSLKHRINCEKFKILLDHTPNHHWEEYTYFKETGDILISLIVISILLAPSKSKSYFKREIDDDSEEDFPLKSSLSGMEGNTYIRAVRSDIKSWFLWLAIRNNIDFIPFDEESWSLIIRFFLDNLSSSNELEKIEHFSKVDGRPKTLIWYSVKEYFIEPDLNLHFKPFIFKKIDGISYQYTNHPSSIIHRSIPSLASGKTFSYCSEELDINLKEYSTYISKSRFQLMFIDYLASANLEEHHLEKNYESLMEKSSLFLQQNNMNAYKHVNREMAKYYKALLFKQILLSEIENKLIYFPLVFDFRGRMYALSPMSFTFFPETRYAMYTGTYDNKVRESHKYTSRINEILKSFLINLEAEWIFSKINSMDEDVKIASMWILVSIAEPFKTSLGDKSNPKSGVNFEEFIKKGIEISNTWDNNKQNCKYEDKIKIDYYINILSEINSGVLKGWLISKDATASVYQHSIKTLGYANYESLIICNLLSESHWYDPYSCLIFDFKQNYRENTALLRDEISNIFSRKNLKKVMMTEKYAARFPAAKKYFLANFDLESFSIEDQRDILIIFTAFHKYITNENLILASSPDAIHEFFEELNWGELKLPEEALVSLAYYESSSVQKGFSYDRERYRGRFMILSGVLNKFKTKLSSEANYIHSIDASFARWLLIHHPCYTVHDCFLTDILNVTNLIAHANEGMNVSFHKINKTPKINENDLKRTHPHLIKFYNKTTREFEYFSICILL